MKIEPNNIYLGDAYQLIKDMEDKSVDLIITDPPYQIEGLESKTRKPSGILRGRKSQSHVNKMAELHLGDGIDLSILNEFIRVMKKINIYIWCNKDQIYDYLTFFVKERKCNWEMLIWTKTNPAPFLNGHYLKDKEYCLYFWEKGVKVNPTYENGKTVFISSLNTLDKNNFEHPTIKPVEIIETLIKNSAGGGSIIFDPFVGSGTTCLAAKHLGFAYIGFEISEKYYKIATDRLQGINAKGEMNLFDI